MKSNPATPLDIVESYFGIQLDRSAVKKLDRTSDDEWIDFAKHYLAVMDDNFAAQFLSVPENGESPLRLFFEPRLDHQWEAEVGRLYGRTPLLGLRSDPGSTLDITRNDVSRMLAPLKKHLLVADSVYVRDNFYYCFDHVADSTSRKRWRDDPNVRSHVLESIRKLKAWLPILIELRSLIDSRALVFMPYYMTPSFPYLADSPQLQAALAKVRSRPRPAEEPPTVTLLGRTVKLSVPRVDVRVDQRAILGAWLNARLLGLDPVFPNRLMFDWAADLYFDEGPGPGDLVSDLISMDILPFGEAEGIHLNDLLKLRKNEEVFDEVRQAVAACKRHLENGTLPTASKEVYAGHCRSFMRERLSHYERKSVLRFVDNNIAAGIAFTAAMGVLLTMPVAPLAVPAIPVLVSTLLVPKVALQASRWFDPKRRAIGYLQALL